MKGVRLENCTLDRLMPAHIRLDESGTIVHAGPTARKIRTGTIAGRDFFELFEIRRPRGIADIGALARVAGEPLTVAPHPHAGLRLKGQAVTIQGGLLLDLSFGIHVVEAVRRFDLTRDDFAHTDMTVEALYLVEANSAALGALRGANLRLDTARSVAEREAQTDPLTGVANRRALERTVEDHVMEGRSFALLSLDLDRFKAINDQHGHEGGDAMLVNVAQILDDEVRGDDLVARLGGDEFVVVLAGDLPEATLSQIAARILDKVSRPIQFGGFDVSLSVSIGMARSADHGSADLQAMLRAADTALYTVKRGGRGQAVLATPKPG